MRAGKSVWGSMFLILVVACALAPAVAASGKAAEESLTVAVFDLEARDRELMKIGGLMRDLIDVQLTVGGELRLVTRTEMEKILGEQKIKIAGITDEAAPRVGRLLGAQVLVTGRVLEVGDQLFCTIKVFGTETSRVYADMAKGDRDDVEKIGKALGQKVAELIKKGKKTLVAQVRLSADELAALKKKLGKKDLPRVFVHVREQVIGERVPDPAGQIEIQNILVKAGFEVVKDKSGDLKKWAEAYLAEGGKQAPPKSSRIDLILLGDGFSQFAARTGDLISCRARVELEALDPGTGRLLASDKETQTAVDLSEQIAAKSALEVAAGKLAYRVLPGAVEKWREIKAKGK